MSRWSATWRSRGRAARPLNARRGHDGRPRHGVRCEQVLLGYFTGTPTEQIPEIAISPGLGLVELVRGHSGFSIEHHDIVDVGRPSLLAS